MTPEAIRTLEQMHACQSSIDSTRPYATLGEWWDKTDRLDYMWWVARNLGIADTKPAILWEVWCARQVQHLMTDHRSVHALDVAERWCYGLATGEELAAARATAEAALAATEAAQRDRLRLTFPASQIDRLFAIKMEELK